MRKRKAFTLIEIEIAMFLFVIFIGAAASLYFTSSFSSNIKLDQTKASLYATEGIEIVKNLKYDSFINLSDGSFTLNRSGDEFSLGSGTETLEGIYDRSVLIEPVYRNASGDIDDAGAVLDSLMKKVTVSVSWNSPLSGNHSVNAVQYMSDWEGTTWTQTTETEFNTGTLNDVAIDSTTSAIADDGEITLASLTTNFSYLGSGNVGAHANDVFHANGIMYAAVDKTNEGLCTVDVTDPANPIQLDCVNIDGKGLAVEVSGNYAYVGTDDFNDGLAVVNISNPSNLVLVRNLDLDGIVQDLVIDAGYLYAAVDDRNKGLTVVDLADADDPIIVSTRHLYNDEGLAIDVNGNFAYVTNDDAEVVTFNISNPNSPSRLAREDLNNDGLAITYKDSYLYIAIDDASEGLEVVNVSDPSNPISVDTYDVDGVGRGVAIVDQALVVAVDIVNDSVKIFDISNPISLNFVTSLDVNGKALKSFATEDYVYIAVDVNNQGVAIVSVGGAGGGSGATVQSGDYISGILDAGAAVDFDSISWQASVPTGSSLQFQIRTADSLANLLGTAGPPAVAEATFVGPDGTDATFYTATPSMITLDPARTGEQFLQWRAYLDKGSSITPTLYDVTIKYEN